MTAPATEATEQTQTTQINTPGQVPGSLGNIGLLYRECWGRLAGRVGKTRPNA